MSNFDKQAVQAVADLKAGYTLGHADVAILNELARIALASLEAEPSYFVNRVKHSDAYGEDVELRTYCYELDALKSKDDFGGEIVPVYTVPPAPFALPVQHWEELCRQNPDMSIGDAIIRAAWWNHCAAMLQGAERVSNRDELPDGWVACSERMPGIGTEIFYFCQDDGLRDCGIVSSSNFSGKGDAELYVHAEGYDLRFGVDISHWMPLPAAPQQEVNHG